MILNKIENPNNQKVTDPAVINHLSSLGLKKEDVIFKYDYSSSFPKSKMYQVQNGKNKGNHIVVISNLNMVTPDNSKIIPGFYKVNDKYVLKNNLFEGEVESSGRIALSINKSDCIWSPQLFLGQTEIKALSGPILFETDPINNNYHENYLEWNYGICKRYIRVIEGRLLERWVFISNPGNDVRIVHNCKTETKPILGMYASNDDVEFISKSSFDISSYPISISATLTSNPSYDGTLFRNGANLTWDYMHDTPAAALLYNMDSDWFDFMYVSCDGSPLNTFAGMMRGFLIFDISSIISGSTITSSSISLAKSSNSTRFSIFSAAYSIFTFNPTNPASIAVGDYNYTKHGTTPLTPTIDDDVWYGLTNDMYREFVMNASGLSYLSGLVGTQYACFSGRCSWDWTDNPPDIGAASGTLRWAIRSTEAGATLKPKLIIGYEPPVLTKFLKRIKFNELNSFIK
jgi:hypothetical protein